MDQSDRLRGETVAVWVTVACFLLGAVAALAVLGPDPRPLIGSGALALPAATIAGVIAGGAFVVSTLRHRRGETRPMPRWQKVVTDVSAIALTVAFVGVTGLGVLLGMQVLAIGLQGLELTTVGGALVTGFAAAVGGRFAFAAGIGLRTADLSSILFGYLVIGTLFAMVTAADPRWWEVNFSQLGMGDDAWAFNGTLIVAGVLVGTVGAYIGRDLHRVLGDPALGRIAITSGLWIVTGVGLAGVGLLPLHRFPEAHNVVAPVTLLLFAASMTMTAVIVPGAPRALTITTIGVGALVTVAFVLFAVFGLITMTALEAMAVGLGLLWMTTLVRVLAILSPDVPRASRRAHLLHG
ncbi:DUF998 domain-containing protein [uncultured Microbacterium sp.]|uniref:DUF998 domain-containing protein n=1 Tax=uncultured Microbacterium sp. TaxID=191216 RepID=UPI0028DB1E20|nr:DUF998 domain-containing protein [uncultured Microbacterium sp.]